MSKRQVDLPNESNFDNELEEFDVHRLLNRFWENQTENIEKLTPVSKVFSVPCLLIIVIFHLFYRNMSHLLVGTYFQYFKYLMIYCRNIFALR